MLKKIVFFSLLSFFTVSNSLYAKMVSGKIASIDSSTRKISVSTLDAVSGQASISDIWADADAVFSGVTSLAEIHAGDNVWVEAETDSEGNLRASKITKT